jgi:hypothetical protein
MKTILLVLSALSITTASYAHTNSIEASELPAIQAGIDARNLFVSALEKRDFTEIARQAFENAILTAVEDLRERNDEAMATELLDQWRSFDFHAAAFMSQFHDLGDHAPLFPWLDEFFKKMASKYGSIIYSLPYVQDLNTLNYALPVVFAPKGSWQSADFDNRIEYRKHFIPFANIVTYYVSLYGCKYIAAKQGIDGKQLCPKVADRLKHVMGRYIAAPVSDWIFKTANRGTTTRLKVSDSSLRYKTAEELRRAIQN